MGFDDLHTEQQLELAVPARFTPERATPQTAGELITADAEDRERARRRLAQMQDDLAGGAD